MTKTLKADRRLATFLTARRLALNLSRSQVCVDTGLGISTLRRVESLEDDADCNLKTLKRLCDRYGITLEDLCNNAKI